VWVPEQEGGRRGGRTRRGDEDARRGETRRREDEDEGDEDGGDEEGDEEGGWRGWMPKREQEGRRRASPNDAWGGERHCQYKLEDW
jgi:hypothetical protein